MVAIFGDWLPHKGIRLTQIYSEVNGQYPRAVLKKIIANSLVHRPTEVVSSP